MEMVQRIVFRGSFHLPEERDEREGVRLLERERDAVLGSHPAVLDTNENDMKSSSF